MRQYSRRVPTHTHTWWAVGVPLLEQTTLGDLPVFNAFLGPSSLYPAGAARREARCFLIMPLARGWNLLKDPFVVLMSSDRLLPRSPLVIIVATRDLVFVRYEYNRLNTVFLLFAGTQTSKQSTIHAVWWI